MAKFAEDGQPTPSQVRMSQPAIRARQQQDNFGGTVLIIVLWTVNERGSNGCNVSNKANALELTPFPLLYAEIHKVIESKETVKFTFQRPLHDLSESA